MTGYERIKEMNTDELVEQLEFGCISCIHRNEDVDCSEAGYKCRDGIRKWLESETDW